MRSLSESCDVYYYELSQAVGIERIAAMARRLGLGQTYDLPLVSVADGRVPTREWKRETRDADWLIGDTLNATIGQGFVLASPLQLAVMTARLATGARVMPRLLRAVDGIEQVPVGGETLGLHPDNLALVRQGLFDVVNAERGTALSARVVADGIRMAGKTGTSQVRNITVAEREEGVTANEDLPWERRDHALFVGYAPHDTPEVAVAVVVEHGGGGAAVAAPIARDVLLAALYDDVPPLEAYPPSQRGTIRARFDALNLRAPLAPSEGRSRA